MHKWHLRTLLSDQHYINCLIIKSNYSHYNGQEERTTKQFCLKTLGFRKEISAEVYNHNHMDTKDEPP
jgi:hypothetical protein